MAKPEFPSINNHNQKNPLSKVRELSVEGKNEESFINTINQMN
jgi:hypothetical protein